MFFVLRVSTMATSLAVLSVVRALSIDNQLTPHVSDCFERLAIGERLNPDKIYKNFMYKTVADCKMACSNEKKSCKAFAFGISAKGNATCELTSDPIKETADLKPIGTLTDTDFDLYIKKLDCTLVIDKSPHKKPSEEDFRPALKPVTLGNIHSDEADHHKPEPSTYGEQKPPDKPARRPDLNHHYHTASDNEEVNHVQALVSVASGPQSVLNPVHGILVAGGANGGYQGPPEKLPPFRPDALPQPYDDDRIRPNPDNFDRPDPDYLFQLDESGNLFNRPYGPLDRPYGVLNTPDWDRYDVLKPDGSEYQFDRYADRPTINPFRPRPDYFDQNRPLPNRYGSLIPHPDDYNKPFLHSEYLYQQEHHHQEYHSEHFHHVDIDDPNLAYDDRRRPYAGNSLYGEPYRKPHYDKPSRPVSLSQTYDDERPTKPGPALAGDYGKPGRPPSDKRPPRPASDGYGTNYEDEKPLRPSQKPLASYGGDIDRPNGNRPYDDSRPNTDRPYDDSRPNSNMPYDDFRPNSNRPYDDSRPNSNRPYDDSRPNSNRPYDDSRPNSNRPYDDSRPNSNRPYDDSRPNSNRPYEDFRPNSNRPYDDSRPNSNSPHDDSRPNSNRPYDDSRPNSNRPYDDSGPNSNRPYDDSRPNSNRPYDDSRPNGNSPYDDSRPNSNRPLEDSNKRPYHDKISSRPKPGDFGFNYSDYGDGKKQPQGSMGSRPMITHSTGYNGGQITSIITELENDVERYSVTTEDTRPEALT